MSSATACRLHVDYTPPARPRRHRAVWLYDLATRHMLHVTRRWLMTPYDLAAEELIAVTRKWYARQLATYRREYRRARKPPSTFGVYRSSRVLTPEQEKAIARAVRVVRGDEDLRQSITLRLLAYKKPIPNLEAFCANAAKWLFRDELRKRETRNEVPYNEAPKNEDTPPTCPILRGGEDALIEIIDRRRGRRRLTTKFDRDLWWDELLAWTATRIREERRERPEGPTLAALIELYARKSPPWRVPLFSDSTPADVYRPVYERVKKRVQRDVLKNRHSCPPKQTTSNVYNSRSPANEPRSINQQILRARGESA